MIVRDLAVEGNRANVGELGNLLLRKARHQLHQRLTLSHAGRGIKVQGREALVIDAAHSAAAHHLHSAQVHISVVALLNPQVECGFAMPVGCRTIGAAGAWYRARAANDAVSLDFPVCAVVASRGRRSWIRGRSLGERCGATQRGGQCGPEQAANKTVDPANLMSRRRRKISPTYCCRGGFPDEELHDSFGIELGFVLGSFRFVLGSFFCSCVDYKRLLGFVFAIRPTPPGGTQDFAL